MICIERPAFLWKKFSVLALFLLIAPIALTTSFFTLNTYTNNKVIAEVVPYSPNLIDLPQSGVSVFAALPADASTIGGEVLGADARVEMVRQYLARYNSPLEPFAQTIVDAADANGLDYRLTTAIAQQESNLCKIIPPETYNCWGWGIHSRGTLGFASYEDGIRIVTKGIKEGYIDDGLTTVEEIMSRYTPLSPGSWAFGVNQFMGQMQ